MKKIILGLLFIVLCASGCSLKTGTSIDRFITIDNSSEISNYCKKNKEDAEKNIQAFRLGDDQKIIYEIWKQSIMSVNKISKDYFDKHIFLGWIWENDGYNDSHTYTFSYYIKVGDMYLRHRTNDVVRIKKSELERFKQNTAAQLLVEAVSSKLDNDDNSVVFYLNFKWGEIGLGNFRGLINSAVSDSIKCENTISLFSQCHANILPGDIMYTPQHELARSKKFPLVTIHGSTWNINDCTIGTVDVLGQKIFDCNTTGANCSKEIGL